MSKELSILNDTPHWLMKLAYENRDDIDAVEMALAENLNGAPAPTNLRAHARALIKFAVEEREADSMASAPVTVDYLSRRVDTALIDEVERIVKECKVLRGIVADSQGDQNKRYKAFGNRVLTAQEAQEALTLNIKTLIDIKKSASEQKRADGGAGTNINLNFGNIIGDAIKNIKEVEAEVL